jgi:hypothetical protein
MIDHARTAAAFATLCLAACVHASDADASPDAGARRFIDAKTLFQTNVGYDPRIGIAVDAVVVHRHGDPLDPLRKIVGSWKEHGYRVGRMFFADSDARNEYWTGKWDGTPHPDDREHDAKGNPVLCSNIRPYMLPTEGWIRHLEAMTDVSIQAGADAILPEEPLAHVFTGYEASFKKLWEERYGRPWEPESASLEARYLTAQLKEELYVKLETRLAALTKKRSRELGRDIGFVVPIHSLYSNLAARLVAPLGTAREIKPVDGYIGQIWTGPVNWALGHYGSDDKSFFASAYVLYDYFVAMVRGTDRRLWLLVDPVEDNPNHTWTEFEEWYHHCVVAQFLLPETDRYEVMPWPDRIFLPGYSMGGGSPAPEPFRVSILSVLQAQQEIPLSGRWCTDVTGPVTEGLGIVLADTAMWEKSDPPVHGLYALLLPLVNEGVPVQAALAERFGEPGYLSRFKALVVSFEEWKPPAAAVNEALSAWTRAGGSLVVLGEPDDYGAPAMWWRQAGYASALDHLLAVLGVADAGEGTHSVGRGCVLRRRVSPRAFAARARAEADYLPLVDEALHRAGAAEGLARPGALCMRRGPFVIAHAIRRPILIRGAFVDVFDPTLPLIDRVELAPGQGGVYRDVTPIIDADPSRAATPAVLHTTHRLMETRATGNALALTIRGPAETPGVVRLFTADRRITHVTGTNAAGRDVPTDWQQDGRTALIRFGNDPSGVGLSVRFSSPP